MTQRLFGVVGILALAMILAAPAHARTSTKNQKQHYSTGECFTDEDRGGGHRICGGGSKARMASSESARPQKAPVHLAAKAAPAANAQPAKVPVPLKGGVAEGDGGIVAEARRYLGATAAQLGLRRSLWCGAFMDMVLRKTGHKGGGNYSLDYARYGRRLPAPQVGAVVVMTRSGGGHVGVVSGIKANGDVVVISGNHGNRVAESVYPRRRIIASVIPA